MKNASEVFIVLFCCPSSWKESKHNIKLHIWIIAHVNDKHPSLIKKENQPLIFFSTNVKLMYASFVIKNRSSWGGQIPWKEIRKRKYLIYSKESNRKKMNTRTQITSIPIYFWSSYFWLTLSCLPFSHVRPWLPSQPPSALRRHWVSHPAQSSSASPSASSPAQRPCSFGAASSCVVHVSCLLQSVHPFLSVPLGLELSKKNK